MSEIDFKRGDKVVRINYGTTGVILGQEDLEDYEKSRPGPKWEAVEWDDPAPDQKGKRTWCGNKGLEKIQDEQVL